MKAVFNGSFTQQEPIPQDGIAAAVAVLQHGRLHRYNVVPGETAETALLEKEFAEYTGARFCLAVASGGYALGAAMRAAGVKAGDTVLTNAFTLAPVPGAIAALGAQPVFVEVTEDLVIDLSDLAKKAKANNARYLLLSHMRGHICDMDALMALCDAHGIAVIEDCAHTMGANWNGTQSGRFGIAGCYSTQTYKHMNSGEGGLIVSDDPDLMARMIMLSGSYMLFDRHSAGPAADVFDEIRYMTPNVSGRMDNLRAAILRPQLRRLDQQCTAWNARYRVVENGLKDVPGLRLIPRPEKEGFVASSFQFSLPDWTDEQISAVVKACALRGVELKWFGAAEPVGFTSRHDSWRYAQKQSLPQTDRVLHGLLDMRLPLTFSLEDCALIAQIIADEVRNSGEA
jgi:dTDP-4-amino-4,6-dideoxygalactose transaminase